MRVIVMFDLLMNTAKERSDYVHFRKNLIREGYIMMQQSIYNKLVLSPQAADLARQRVKNFLPPKGTVQLMVITEKQYADIDYLLGQAQTRQVDSTDRLVIF